MVSHGTQWVFNQCLLHEVTTKGYINFLASRTLDNPPVAAGARADPPLPLTLGTAGQT